MTLRYAYICTGALLAAIVFQSEAARALSMQECSAKYKAAKDAGTLNGMKWNDFRKAQCGAETAAAPAPPPAQLAPNRPPKPAALPTPAAAGHPAFPSAVSPKYWASQRAKRVCTPV